MKHETLHNYLLSKYDLRLQDEDLQCIADVVKVDEDKSGSTLKYTIRLIISLAGIFVSVWKLSDCAFALLVTTAILSTFSAFVTIKKMYA